MASATRRNFNALLFSGTPGLASRTSAASARVVAIGTQNRSINAGVGLGTEQESGFDGQASTAVVVSLTAGRDRNALLLSSAPGDVGNTAFAFSALIKVVGTSSRNGGASIGCWAPSESGLQSSTFATVVMSSATIWNLNASFFSRAPSSTRSSADTVAAVVVVVGTFDRDGVTGQILSAPGEPGLY